MTRGRGLLTAGHRATSGPWASITHPDTVELIASSVRSGDFGSKRSTIEDLGSTAPDYPKNQACNKSEEEPIKVQRDRWSSHCRRRSRLPWSRGTPGTKQRWRRPVEGGHARTFGWSALGGSERCRDREWRDPYDTSFRVVGGCLSDLTVLHVPCGGQFRIRQGIPPTEIERIPYGETRAS